MDLQAVIFDFDGVLCDTVEYHYRSWKRLAQEYGFPFDRKVNEKLLGLTRRRSLEVILDGRLPSEETTQEMLRRKNQYYLELVDQMTSDDLLSGVIELLEELRQANLKVGVASASRNARRVLEQIGVDGYINVIADGNTVQRSKPAPDVYLEAAQGLRVESEACIAIEDSQAGVRAALLAGMCVIGLGPPQRVGKAQAVFPDLSSVRLSNLYFIYRWWEAARPSSASELAQASETEPESIQ
jgi:kojibiose phosphorylase